MYSRYQHVTQASWELQQLLQNTGSIIGGKVMGGEGIKVSK